MIAHIPPARALAATRPGRHLARTARSARAVQDPLRFSVLELAPPRAACHRLRRSELRVYLRHRTRDVDIFREIFGSVPGAYEPPAPVAAALEAVGAPRVLDLGGNIGLFGAYLLSRWPDATLRSFEPDPTNLPLLRRVVSANHLQTRWQVIAAAVANADGEMPFVSGLLAESQLSGIGDPQARAPDAASLETGATILVPTVDLFAQDHDVELLKIDIEGGEWSILTDPRLGDLEARAVVLEWHAMGCAEDDPRAAALQRLAAAGYEHVQETENLGHTGLVWAWRGR